MKNIGILFSQLAGGGVFQYGLSVADALINYSNNFSYSIFYYGSENPKDSLRIKSPENVRFIALGAEANSLIQKSQFLLNLLLSQPIFVTNKKNKKILEKNNIDLLIIPFPFLLGFEARIPYIVAIPDIMHRYYPQFPEYHFKTRIKRDLVYKNAAKHSFFSIVDSSQGKADLHKFYNIPNEKIKIIPYIPPGYIYQYQEMSEDSAEKILAKHNLPNKFLFYPAQFWYQKNHLRLIKAISLLKKELDVEISLVLTGSAKANEENYQKVKALINELNLGQQVFHLGFVSDEEIGALYKKSLALVFPTLIGPTSIPPLEAMVMRTPVLCSNLFSMPEQIGEAGLLFNPFDIKDIAEKIYKIWTDEKLRIQLVKKGEERLKDLTLENYAQKWENIIKQTLKYE